MSGASLLTRLLSWTVVVSVLLGAAPPLVRPVTDPRGVLSVTEREHVERELGRLFSDKGVQMAVLVVDTTRGESFTAYASQAAEGWRRAQASRDNGLVLVMALADERMHLDVSPGLEAHLPEPVVRELLDTQWSLLLKKNVVGAIVQLIRDVHTRLPLAPGVERDPETSPAVSSWSGHERSRTLRSLGVLVMLLFVGVSVLNHPALQRKLAASVRFGLSGAAGLLALAAALHESWGARVPTLDLGVLFAVLCGAVLLGRWLLFHGDAARVGLALILGPMGVLFYFSMQYELGPTEELFSRMFGLSLLAGLVVFVATFETFYNAAATGLISLIAGYEAVERWDHAPAQKFTFTLGHRRTTPALKRDMFTSGSSSLESSPVSDPTWKDGGKGEGGASSYW